MRVLLGNEAPLDAPGPSISYSDVRDLSGYIVGSDALAVKDHLFDNPGVVTHLPGMGVILEIVGSWRAVSNKKPLWVAAAAEEGEDPAVVDDIERFIADFWRIPRGTPDDLEATHYTFAGPPGVGV